MLKQIKWSAIGLGAGEIAAGIRPDLPGQIFPDET